MVIERVFVIDASLPALLSGTHGKKVGAEVVARYIHLVDARRVFTAGKRNEYLEILHDVVGKITHQRIVSVSLSSKLGCHVDTHDTVKLLARFSEAQHQVLAVVEQSPGVVLGDTACAVLVFVVDKASVCNFALDLYRTVRPGNVYKFGDTRAHLRYGTTVAAPYPAAAAQCLIPQQ